MKSGVCNGSEIWERKRITEGHVLQTWDVSHRCWKWLRHITKWTNKPTAKYRHRWRSVALEIALRQDEIKMTPLSSWIMNCTNIQICLFVIDAAVLIPPARMRCRLKEGKKGRKYEVINIYIYIFFVFFLLFRICPTYIKTYLFRITYVSKSIK
jgi:hypothetical protein